jgi:hypothetical protein
MLRGNVRVIIVYQEPLMVFSSILMWEVLSCLKHGAGSLNIPGVKAASWTDFLENLRLLLLHSSRMYRRLSCIAWIGWEAHLFTIDGNWHVIVVEISLTLVSRCCQNAYLQMLSYFLWRHHPCIWVLYLTWLSQYQIWGNNMPRLPFSLHYSKWRSLVVACVVRILRHLRILVIDCAKLRRIRCSLGKRGSEWCFGVEVFGVCFIYKNNALFLTLRGIWHPRGNAKKEQ